jgi:hypothetical protein
MIQENAPLLELSMIYGAIALSYGASSMDAAGRWLKQIRLYGIDPAGEGRYRPE